MKKIDIYERKNLFRLTLERFSKKNIEIIYKDITPINLKKGGFYVIRVIIPDLQPFYLDERYKFLKNERLYKGELSRLNSVPHPFL